MKFDELGILLSCHTFEDFPVFHRGEDADRLLVSWTTLWHPALIAATHRMPTWFRLDQPPDADKPRLLALPLPHESADPQGLRQSIESAGGRLVEGAVTRDAFLEAAFPEGTPQDRWDPELVRDFYALGFAYLQIRLLTRQMRYASQMSNEAFADNVVAAADAAGEGHLEQARSLVQSCFDLLSQERDHYYAVDVYLIDLALIAETLVGPALAEQLGSATKVNLQVPASVLPVIAGDAELWELLQAGLEANRIGLVGGDYRELPTTLLASETVQFQLEHGLHEFQERLGRRPQVYGRRTFGLAPALPQLLLRTGFSGAIHATFDGGRFPEATQAKSRWEGDGQFSLDAITRAPQDATASATFLNLATSISESMDMDHIATRCFVHPVGQTSPWFEELKRVTRYTQALGRFVTVEEYFRDTYDPGIHDRFEVNQYRSPYLAGSVAANDPRPISKWMHYWRNWVTLQCWQNACTMQLMVRDGEEARATERDVTERIRQFGTNPVDPSWDHASQEIRGSWQRTVERLAQDVTGSAASSEDRQPGSGEAACYASLNLLGFPRRVYLSSDSIVPSTDPPVYATDVMNALQVQVALDVPGMGIATVQPAAKPPRGTRKTPPPLAEGTQLRNEFFEAQVDPETGGLHGLRTYQSRTNRISQQLAIRWPGKAVGPRAEPEYSTMVADSVTLLHADTMEGRIETAGRLLGKNGEPLARFTQVFTVRRGSRVLELDVGVQPEIEFEANPWEHYLAARFAWSNEAAELTRGINGVRQPATKKQVEAPLYLELDDGDQRTTILAGGIPFHQRSGPRMIETLLLVRGESERQFRLGLGVDLKQPMREALSWLTPSGTVKLSSPTRVSSTWLFHLDARNVITQTWQPIFHGGSDGQQTVAGVRVRMLEAEGRVCQPVLRSFRPLQSVRKIDAQGNTVDVYEPDGDEVTFRVSPQELLELELLFDTGKATDR
jgi:alpha-mannosidase